MKRKSNRWKTRTRGSRRQIGTPFIVGSSQQKLKSNLPRISRRPPKWIMKEYSVSIKDKDGNELANISEYAHSDKEAIAKAKKQLRIKDAAFYEAVSIAGKTLRLLRAPKTAESMEKGLKKTKQFVEEIIGETQKDIREFEHMASKPSKHETPPLPPS